MVVQRSLFCDFTIFTKRSLAFFIFNENFISCFYAFIYFWVWTYFLLLIAKWKLSFKLCSRIVLIMANVLSQWPSFFWRNHSHNLNHSLLLLLWQIKRTISYKISHKQQGHWGIKKREIGQTNRKSLVNQANLFLSFKPWRIIVLEDIPIKNCIARNKCQVRAQEKCSRLK